MDEKSELNTRLAGINDQLRAKNVKLRALEDGLNQAVGPILDAPNTTTRKKLSALRREMLAEAELLRAEIALLRYRREGCESALRRIGEVFTPTPPRAEPLPEHR